MMMNHYHQMLMSAFQQIKFQQMTQLDSSAAGLFLKGKGFSRLSSCPKLSHIYPYIHISKKCPILSHILANCPIFQPHLGILRVDVAYCLFHFIVVQRFVMRKSNCHRRISK